MKVKTKNDTFDLRPASEAPKLVPPAMIPKQAKAERVQLRVQGQSKSPKDLSPRSERKARLVTRSVAVNTTLNMM